MPELSTPQQEELDRRRGTHAHVLLWLSARNRQSGATETIGFWTGDDHRSFTIDGQARTYHGAGAVIDVDPVRAGIGLEVRYHRIVLPPVRDEVQLALRSYEPRLAGVEVHVALMGLSGRPLGPPIRMVKGQLNEAPETLGPPEAPSGLALKVASSARALTFGLPLYRSDEAQRRRDPADRGREYADVVADWTTPWGET